MATKEMRDMAVKIALRNISEPNWQWPETMQLPPWKLPIGFHPESIKINEILQQSLDFQRSTAPPVFNQYINTDNCFETAGLMYHYLKSFCAKFTITDIPMKFIFGIMETEISGMPYEGVPHCWLEVNGQIIDNCFTYSSDPGIGQRSVLQMRQVKYYNKSEDIMTTKKRLFIDDLDESFSLNNYKIMCETDDRIEQRLVFFMSLAGAPGIRVLDSLMKKFLFKRFKIQVEDLTDKWENQCWNCNEKSKDLKRCAGCKCAMYCSTECQKAYRKVDKALDKERKNYDNEMRLRVCPF